MRKTSRSARIETSIWSRLGSRVVRRWSQRPGARIVRRIGLCGCLPGEADHLVGEARDDREQQDARDDQPLPVEPPEEGEDEDRDHHHVEQERRSAAHVDQAVASAPLGLELVAGLERVDRLVLGGVVLEDALQVGEQRDQEQVADEERRRG